MRDGRDANLTYRNRIAPALCAIALGGVAGSAAAAAGDTVIARGATPVKIAGGFGFTEGPASDAQGNVYFTDQPNDRILRWAVDGGITTFLEPAGRANGLCVDKEGDIWACADARNELWRIRPRAGVARGADATAVTGGARADATAVTGGARADATAVAGGDHTVVVAKYKEKLLNGPNDVWLRPDGGLYITDPYYARSYWKRPPQEQDVQGVYYLAPGGAALVRVADDLKKPNGIIGTPDGKTLYVSDIDGGKTYSYTIERDGSLTNKRPFCDMGSDGMTIDNEGDVYLTGSGVTVFDPSGREIDRIPIPEPWTGNVCFGGRDRKTLFITASTAVYTLSMRTHGVGSQ